MIGLFLLLWVLPLRAQDLPRCGDREFIVSLPLSDPNLYCIERPVKLEAGEWAATALIFTDDGTLYFVRPYSGELYALRDSNGDQLPDTPEMVADGMRLPAGLATDGTALYILGDGVLYRYQDETLTVLLDDLPSGRGFPASGIAVHAGMIYLGIPMPCDFCEGDNPLHGTILRYDLASAERSIIARGLRYPAALAWYDNRLWVTDTGRDGLYTAQINRERWRNLDEINAFTPDSNTIPHFGFPYCTGDNQPDLSADFDCEQALAPILNSPTQSTPSALVVYQGTAFPHLRGELLVALAGSINLSQVRGFQILALDMVRADQRIQIETIAPTAPVFSQAPTVGFYDEFGAIPNEHAYDISISGAGFFPHKVLGLAVSPQGWIYISIGGGSIYVLRPGDGEICAIRECK
jgi:glucose/arabinose dehydrogenase